VKLPPHPAWRRLYANGGAPARALERMTQAGRKLERLGSDSALPQWLFAPSLESLLRPIDLSGIERKAAAISERRAAKEMTHAAVLRRAPEQVEGLRQDTAAELASPRDIAPAAVAADKSRSAAAPIVTPAYAAASLRRRATRAGDPAIARSTFASELSGAVTNSDLSAGDALQPRSSPASDTAGGATQTQRSDAIARIARTLQDLRGATAGSGRRRARGRLRRQWLAEGASASQDPAEFGSAEQGGLRGLAARGSRGVHSSSDFAARRRWQIENTPGAAEAPVSAEVGPRGLAARVSRRAAHDLSVEGARNAPDLDDFAERLDRLLRREARRNGIDLEEIDR
jgi:hypothetical protein